MMTDYMLQPGLRRGRLANRVGAALLVALVAVLALSVYSGVTGLAR
jgi:hypothetical protein